MNTFCRYKSKNFDESGKSCRRKSNSANARQGEAVGYAADGKAIFATSEKADSPLIEVKSKIILRIVRPLYRISYNLENLPIGIYK